MKMIVSLIAASFALSAVSVAMAMPGASDPSAGGPPEVRSRTFTAEEVQKMAKARAVIETAFGKIEIRFFPELAPNHVESFISLAKQGFFDGTQFHRLVPGFVIQGGDPNSRGADRAKYGLGGPGYNIKAEFSQKPHVRGTLSMARSRNPDSGGSQFFVCVAPAAFLDGQYTVFGEVVSGMDVADKIVSQPRDSFDRPLERMDMKVRIVE